MNDSKQEKKQEMIDMGWLESFKSTIMYGMAAMKGLYWLSGGAAAALLAFMGYLIAHGYAGLTPYLAVSLCLFFFAALLAAGSLGFSYLSQAQYTKDNDNFGNTFQAMAVALTVGAYISNLVAVVETCLVLRNLR